MSIPIYLLDDGSIVFTEEDLNHVEFWEQTVAAIVAKKHRISTKSILNLPYCQKRARVVKNTLYCGEEIDLETVYKIVLLLNRELTLKYDVHESRLPYDVSQFRAIVQDR